MFDNYYLTIINSFNYYFTFNFWLWFW